MSPSNHTSFVRLVLFVSVLGAAATSLHATPPDFTPEVFLYRVHVVEPEREIPALAALNLDIAGIDRKASTVDIVGDRQTLALLESRGFVTEVARDLTPGEGTIQALSDYLDPAEIEALLDQWVAAYPTLARKVQYATTEQGRPVWALEISDNVNLEEDEPAIFFVAQHHAREVMTPEIATDLARMLLEGYGSDPRITRWVDTREIWVLPNHNPDGAQHVFTVNSNWRKNRRDNLDGTFGVDLNRNYPFRWGACNGSDGSTSSETYRGPSHASEPETWQGIMELAREQRPVINLSYHTTSELVIMPFGCSGSHTSEKPAFRDLSSTMATRLISDNGQHWYENGTGWEILYAVDGEMNDWFYAELGSYGLTVEANASSQGFQPDYATWRDGTVARNRPGWEYLLDRLDGPSIQGHVTDACTGDPLAAGISLDEVDFVSGETPRTAEPVHGRYQWLTVPGEYTLRVDEDGYHEQAWTVSVGFEAADREVRLVPAGSGGLAVVGSFFDDGASDADGQADPGEEARLRVRLVATGTDLTGVTATLVSEDPLVTVLDGTAGYGTLAAGATADGDGFRIRVDAAAPDGHEATLRLTFSANETLCTADETFALRVTTGAPSCPEILESMDADPGWLIENTGSGGWQFGPPTGNGGSTGPASPKTGTNVYGTNLSGVYGNSGDFLLTTGSYDLRGLRSTELRYWRWLHNEAGFDLASVEVSVDGGAVWTEVWSGFLYGDGWELHRIDVSDWADLEDDVRFRFRLRSDVNTARAGFYVDDFQLCGEAVPHAGGKLKYESHAVDDSDPDGGNGNGAVDAGETVILPVTVRSNRDVASTGVEAFLSTTTPGVTVRTAYATFGDVPAGSLGGSLAPHFSLSVGSGACATRATFQLRVRWAGGEATSSFVVPVGTPATAVVLDDAFETDLGWTTGGDASAGYWERGNPYGVDDSLGTPVQPEDDHTPDPGVLCWVTANPRPKGNFQPGDGDVDGGTVWLESPGFDGTNAERLDVELERWFVRRNPGIFDSSAFRVLASNDDGLSWTILDESNVDAPAWTAARYDLVDYLGPTQNMRIRIEAEENTGFGGDTLLEALIDDVRVERERLECAPWTEPSRHAPNAVGNVLVLGTSGRDLRMDWQAPPVDAGHDAAAGYRVYRSAAPGTGYSVLSRPTAEFEVLADDLLDPGGGYFLIVAENAGGTSGDEPAP